MATTQFPHRTNGTNIMSDDWDKLLDALNLLLANALSNGATVNAVTADPSVASGVSTQTPDGSGNFNIGYGVSFAASPSVIVCGSGARPNTLVTVSASGPGPNSFTVHCQDVTTGNPITTGTVTVYWQAMRK